ncbi:CBS domain-containing protein [Nitrogeniibacter mangrovi]|uniref:CBS domain-containing protein n=1 Tax=Nitrogeniibacter mangrovi TaxID=2016596 RepID=A0A6C1B1B7_9RHOO|nr:CBS domain-containing protein [Nitrogeniibacter mangrovi]QID16705.1 CBS domain-containing protein [Nitrogeniibacter mangrovi]
MPTRPIQHILHPESRVVASADASVRDVVHLMAQRNANAVMITEHGVLTGIFTEHDATFGVLAADRDPDTTPVAEVMTHNPVAIGPDHPLGHALHMMYEGGFRHVPVIDENRRPLGMVASTDALRIEAVEFGAELERREEITVIL